MPDPVFLHHLDECSHRGCMKHETPLVASPHAPGITPCEEDVCPNAI